MELPKRKHPRLKNFDYSEPGYYFVTVHCQDYNTKLSIVGRGLAPAGTQVRLTELGQIARKQLFELEKRYSYVRIDKYVVMPTHIHAIIELKQKTAGASPPPYAVGHHMYIQIFDNPDF